MVPERCFFCEKSFEPSAEDFKTLEPFLTRRGKIRGKKRSGLCTKHQRRLAKEIKRARNLGLLPYKIEG
jgi:small subunit ribosomal protein S18